MNVAELQILLSCYLQPEEQLVMYILLGIDFLPTDQIKDKFLSRFCGGQ